MKKIIFASTLIIFIAGSCQKLKDVGATTAVKVSNEWWATLDSVGTTDYNGWGQIKIATYNTSNNDNHIWLDDFGKGYGFKIKAAVDYKALTFSSEDSAANDYYDGTTTFPKSAHITDGKIFPKMGHSRSGNVVDSIHFKIEFSDNPGFIYEMNAVARTRFAEDDY